MRFSAQLLSENEIEKIHQMSLKILEEVGIRYLGDKAPIILHQHGVKFESPDGIAKIPAELVMHALDIAPKSFILGARNPKYDFALPAPSTRYGIDGTAAFALDFHTGERRYGTSTDIENALRIFQKMDLGVMAWAPTCAMDKPAHVRALHEFFCMAKFTSKHGEHELHRREQVPFLVEGLVAIMGSEAALRQRNAYSLIYCPVAPLTHDGQMLDAYLELGQVGLPVMCMPMPVTGTTGPASLYSNIALANAEMLSSLVIFQLAHPGRPIIFSSSTGTVDFRNGAYLAGVPEMGLQTAALAVMGKYYGFPTGGAGFTSDAKQAGPQATIEKLLTTLPAALVGTDILVGFGEIDSDQLLILEQIVVDNEIAHLVERLAQGVESSIERELFDDIASVGPGGHFLGRKSTRQAAHSAEFYTPSLIDHISYETWGSLGKPSLYTNARKVVTSILETPQEDALPDDVLARLDEISRRAELKIKDN